MGKPALLHAPYSVLRLFPSYERRRNPTHLLQPQSQPSVPPSPTPFIRRKREDRSASGQRRRREDRGYDCRSPFPSSTVPSSLLFPPDFGLAPSLSSSTSTHSPIYLRLSLRWAEPYLPNVHPLWRCTPKPAILSSRDPLMGRRGSLREIVPPDASSV
jgi:hypothetical protein